MKIKTTLTEVVITNKDFEKTSPFSQEQFSITFSEIDDRTHFLIMRPFKDLDFSDEANSEKILELNEELFVKTLISWTNISDENDNEMKCTDENKRKMYRFSTLFCNQLMDKVRKKMEKIKKK